MPRFLLLPVVSALIGLTTPLMALASPHGSGAKASAAKVTPAMLAQGKTIYEKNCAACHRTGAAGAPIFGDKAAWKKHIAGGMEHMVGHAIHGEGVMPARGGNPALSDAEVRAAVAYIVENSR